MDLGNFAWLAVIPALGFLVVVHEIGHYWVGRKMGIKIEEFGIGIPPRAKVLFVRKGVPFTLNWLPLGGFVRFAGEESGFDDPDSLMAAPPRRRIPVLAAGVIANILVAMLIFALIFMIWGIPNPDRIEVTTTDAYAESVGFQSGDQLLEVGGEVIGPTSSVIEIVQTSGGEPIEVTVLRDDEAVTFMAAPLYREDTEAYQYGIGLGPGYDRVNPLVALWRGVTYSGEILWSMIAGIGALFGGLLGLMPKPEGDVAGIVGIARLTGDVVQTGMQPYLRLMAMLSLNLAVINILPIPALDGSRIMFALIEAVRRKKIPPEREAVVHAIGMVLLLGLMMVITLADVSKIIQGVPAISIPATPTPGVPTPLP